MFLISWKGLGVFKGAPKLRKVGEGPSRLPHNGSTTERALARATSTKGAVSGGAGGVQNRAHRSM